MKQMLAKLTLYSKLTEAEEDMIDDEGIDFFEFAKDCSAIKAEHLLT